MNKLVKRDIALLEYLKHKYGERTINFRITKLLQGKFNKNKRTINAD